MNIRYRKFTKSDANAVQKMMLCLYQEDPGDNSMNEEKMNRTFETLSTFPEKGEILVIKVDDVIVGYAILIHFWSNEYGGNILNVDELYIQKEYQNQGIGSGFLKHLVQKRPYAAVAIDLETTSHNHRAMELYKRIGFKPWQNIPLRYEFK